MILEPAMNVSEGLMERIITLPCSTSLTDDEINHWLNQIINRN